MESLSLSFKHLISRVLITCCVIRILTLDDAHLVSAECTSNVRVTKIHPRYGSTMGGSRLTVTGQNFKLRDGVSTDPNLGTKGLLVCARKSYPCDFQQDTLTPTLGVCITHPMPQSDAPCRLHILIDGDDIGEDCLAWDHYNGRNDRTPTFEKFETQDGRKSRFVPMSPGQPTKMKLFGKWFTKTVNSAQSTTGNDGDDTPRVRRVYLPWETNEHSVTDFDSSTLKGWLNFGDLTKVYDKAFPTVLIKGGDYGGSRVNEDLLHWNDVTDTPYVYMTHPVITGISPAASSRAGGSRITIHGLVGPIPEPSRNIKVKIGGVYCEVIESFSGYIVVLSPAETDLPSRTPDQFHAGNSLRLYRDIYNVSTTDDIKTESFWKSEPMDDLGYRDEKMEYVKSYMRRMCFQPPRNMTYTFRLLSDDDGTVCFNEQAFNKTCPDPAYMFCSPCTNYQWYSASRRTTEMALEKDKCYLIEAEHYQGPGASYFYLGMAMDDTTLIRNTDNGEPIAPYILQEREIYYACQWRSYKPAIQTLQISAKGNSYKLQYGSNTEHQGPQSATANLNSDKLRDYLYDMLSCHANTKSGWTFTTSFEWDKNLGRSGEYSYQRFSWHSFTNRVPAFDGRTSLERPHTIFNYGYSGLKSRPRIDQKQYVCMAGYGYTRKFHGRFLIPGWRWLWVEFTDILSRPFKDSWHPTRWGMHCYDLRAAVMADTWREEGIGDKNIELDMLTIEAWPDKKKKYWVDSLYIGKNDISGMDSVTSKCILVGGQTVDTISVSGPRANGNTNEYNVTITPYNCATDIELLKEVQGNMVATLQQESSGPTKGTFKFGCPMNGGTLTSELSVQADAETVRDALALACDTDVEVYTYSHRCHRPHYDIRFPSLPGNQPQLTINDSSVICAVTTETDHIYTHDDGGLFERSLPSNFLKTVHDYDKPQVVVEVNGIPSYCNVTATGDCDMSWTDEMTPIVTGIHPNKGTSGASVTITGQNLYGESDDEDMSNISIGGTECADITSHTDELIVCTVGEHQVGSFKVDVYIASKGDAKHSPSTITFTYTVELTSIHPIQGGAHGGYTATVFGHGFGPGSVVKIGNNAGVSNSPITYGQITFEVPQGVIGTENVVVSADEGDSLETVLFTYVEPTDATITSLSPTCVPLTGNTEVTISGTDFVTGMTEDDIMVKAGGTVMSVISYSDTDNQMVFIAAANPVAGDYRVKVRFGNLGWASSTIDLCYKLQVNLICPEEGSYNGGQEVTISGWGFTEATDDLKISIGDIPVMVKSQSNTQIVGTTGSTVREVTVTNQGSHSVYGLGYAWDDTNVQITEGDVVTWSWVTPLPGTENVKIKVHQTASVDTDTKMSNGFDSHPNSDYGTPTGSFSRRFTQVGTFYYSTGPSVRFSGGDPTNDLSMKGKVTVTARSSIRGQLRVQLNDVEASSTPLGSCNDNQSPINGCNDMPPSGIDGEVEYLYSICHTPKVTSMSPTTEARPDSTLVLGVDGGTNNMGNVNIELCNKTCDITASSTNQITCDIQHDNNMNVSQKCSPKVKLINYGDAFIELSQPEVMINAAIDSFLPSQGSKNGGTSVTATGIGFESVGDFVTVQLGDEYATGCQVSYTQIVCQTQKGNGEERGGDVTITTLPHLTSPKPNSIKCTCQYHFTNTKTPTLNTPPLITVDNHANYQLVGSKFGTGTTVEYSETEHEGYDILCTPTSVTNTKVTCPITSMHKHSAAYYCRVRTEDGNSNTERCDVTTSLIGFTPTTSNQCGGLRMSITGFGFSKTVQVDIGGSNVDDVTVLSNTATEIQFNIPSAADSVKGERPVKAKSNNIWMEFETQFNYDEDLNFEITGVNATNGKGGDVLAITGADFATGGVIDSADITLTIGTSDHQIRPGATDTQIIVDLAHTSAGTYDVYMLIANRGCNIDSRSQDTRHQFEFPLLIDDFTPSTGSFGGSQLVTITGTGFAEDVTVTLCDVAMTVTSWTVQQLIVKTPQHSIADEETSTCSLSITINDANLDNTRRRRRATGAGTSATSANTYTYNTALTPRITSLSPKRGGTEGNTLITINGQNFGATQSTSVVTFEDIGNATVESWTDTEIVCRSPRAGMTRDTMVWLKTSNGDSLEKVAYGYVDLWSSITTWGNNPIPQADSAVIIDKGHIVVLDMDTPIIRVIIIKGGTLRFDRTRANTTLSVEYLLILDGGKLEIGTEEDPWPCDKKATIILYGNLRSKELPIYGAKVIAVRNGTLDLHGCHVPYPWTLLAETAKAGSNTLKLMDPARNWNVGDEIALPSTGDHMSQNENEKHEIAAISSDMKTITTVKPLEFDKLVHEGWYGQKFLELRGEIVHLSRNVKVRGHQGDLYKNQTIEACPTGFNPGEFVTQTCFQGRFGEEKGSDQFGGQILIHGPVKDKKFAFARIEYIELTYMGQAFRLGRYPIHWHLLGDMAGAYVRGCAIHQTFNRAINIHGTHNVLVERNGIWNTMGGTLFLEDGVETGNIFQYNFVGFTKASSSLLNDDITPAAYWVTNADNTYQHNAAAGGTHFGWWYRQHKKPDGASINEPVCPQAVPMRLFYNNTAHSMGWFGIWIFQRYCPKVDGSCNSDAPDQPAVFDTFKAWNCEKGAEWVDVCAPQFINFCVVNNKKAGIEAKFAKGTEMMNSKSSLIENLLCVAHIGTLPSRKTVCIILPQLSGVLVKGIRVVNYNVPFAVAFSFAHIDGTCGHLCAGYIFAVREISYWNQNATITTGMNIVHMEWQHQSALRLDDGSLEDGSVAGPEGWVLPTMDILPFGCRDFQGEALSDQGFSNGVPASFCPKDLGWLPVRFAFNHMHPASFNFKASIFTNTNQQSMQGPFADKRLTHKAGWAVILMAEEGKTTEYEMSFLEGVRNATNISYDGSFYLLPDKTCLKISISLAQPPDRCSILNTNFVNESDSLLKNGDWKYSQGILSYLICGPAVEVKVKINCEVCFYPQCIIPDIDGKVKLYSGNCLNDHGDREQNWDEAGTDWLVPTSNADVLVPAKMCLTIRKDLDIKLNSLRIDGCLIVLNDANINVTIEVHYVLVTTGYLVVGTEASPFEGNFNLLLYGSGFDNLVEIDDYSMDIPPKALKITLAQTPKNWQPKDQLYLSPTGFEVRNGEDAEFQSMTGNVVTLKESLQYEHLGITQSLGSSRSETFQGEVGNKNRNIRIKGTGTEMDFGAVTRITQGFIKIKGSSGDSFVPVEGYARVENVEFDSGGKLAKEEGEEFFFKECAFNFLNLGDTTGRHYVKKSAFHSCRGVGVCVVGTGGANIMENFALHTSRTAYYVEGGRNVVFKGNLAVNSSYVLKTGDSVDNYMLHAVINMMHADPDSLQLINNVAAGCERSCIKLPYHACGTTNYNENYFRGNEAHSGLFGVERMKGIGSYDDEPCMEVPSFKVWHMWHFGIYMATHSSLLISNSVIASCGTGIFPMVIKPEALDRTNSICKKSKMVTVKDSVIIGRLDETTCSKTHPEELLDYFKANKDQLKGPRRNMENTSRAGFGGLMLAQFTSGTNQCAKKPCGGIMAYNSVCGLTEVTNVTFSHFKKRCNFLDAAIISSEFNDDLIHPGHFSKITLLNTSDDAIAFIPRSTLGKVNPSDCVDMSCDAMKKVLIVDMDKTLFKGGNNGTVVPDAAWEWTNGIRSYGIGYYRLPTVMLVTSDGSPLDGPTEYPQVGIYRNDQCEAKPEWQANLCYGEHYRLLSLESMDADTEMRRLSPIAFVTYKDLERTTRTSYVDLVNGPQDHGWCAGYTCQKRVSTFHFIAVCGRASDIYLSSTPPQSLRLQLLNSQATCCVRIGTFLNEPSQRKVFVNDDEKSVEQQTVMPNLTESSTSGQNFYDNQTMMLNTIICGSDSIVLKLNPQLVAIFDTEPMTIAEFFSKNPVGNIVLYLGIDPSLVRVSDLVAAASRRRKRSTETISSYNIIIEPSSNGSISADELAAQSEVVQNSASELVSAVQLGKINEVTNTTVTGASVQLPPPPSNLQAWQDYANDENSGQAKDIKIPTLALTRSDPVAAHEGAPFTIPPAIQLLAADGSVVALLGSDAKPWKMKAELIREGEGPSPISSLYNDEVEFFRGWANFTELSISHSGDNYGLRFYVSDPEEARTRTDLQLTVTGLSVSEAEYITQFRSPPTEVSKTQDFTLTLDVLDSITKMIPRNISFKGHTFKATIWVIRKVNYPGTLDPPTSLEMDVSSSGTVTTHGLNLNKIGKAAIMAKVESTPAQWTLLTPEIFIDVNKVSLVDRQRQGRSDITLRFPELSGGRRRREVSEGETPLFMAAVQNYFAHQFVDVTFTNFTDTDNYISFIMYGKTVEIIKATRSMWEQLQSGVTIVFGAKSLKADPYIDIDGDVKEGSPPTGAGGSNAAIIAGAVVGGIIVIVIIVVIVIVVCSKKANEKKVSPEMSEEKTEA